MYTILTREPVVPQNFVTVQNFTVFLKLSSIWYSSTRTGSRLKIILIKICEAMEEDIQVILIHFCGKLNEGNISQKMNHLSLGNW